LNAKQEQISPERDNDFQPKIKVELSSVKKDNYEQAMSAGFGDDDEEFDVKPKVEVKLE
jgi:phage-related protein